MWVSSESAGAWHSARHSARFGGLAFRPGGASISAVKNFTAVVERDPVTGLLIGYVPGFPGAHSQAESLDELNANLREVVAMLLEDGEPKLEAEFVGTQSVAVA